MAEYSNLFEEEQREPNCEPFLKGGVYWQNMSPQNPFKSPNDLLVPQAVNEGVQSWGDNCIEHRDDIVLLRAVKGTG